MPFLFSPPISLPGCDIQELHPVLDSPLLTFCNLAPNSFFWVFCKTLSEGKNPLLKHSQLLPQRGTVCSAKRMSQFSEQKNIAINQRTQCAAKAIGCTQGLKGRLWSRIHGEKKKLKNPQSSSAKTPFPCFQTKYFAVVFLVIAAVSGGMGADAEPERNAAFKASILQKGTVDEVIQKCSAGKGCSTLVAFSLCCRWVPAPCACCLVLFSSLV